MIPKTVSMPYVIYLLPFLFMGMLASSFTVAACFSAVYVVAVFIWGKIS